MLQCVAVCCSVLQSAAVRPLPFSVARRPFVSYPPRHLSHPPQRCVAVCGCRVLQCAAVCCSVLQCAAACCSVLQRDAVCCSVLQCVAARPSTFSVARRLFVSYPPGHFSRNHPTPFQLTLFLP